MRWVFNPPPGWPQPPGGWIPPPGWAPSPRWPPPPLHWRFWRRRIHPVAFHLLGAAILGLVALADRVAVGVLGLLTSRCGDTGGHLATLRVGTGICGLILTAVPLGWARRAQRTQRHAVTWWVIAGLCGVLAAIAAGTVSVPQFCLY